MERNIHCSTKGKERRDGRDNLLGNVVTCLARFILGETEREEEREGEGKRETLECRAGWPHSQQLTIFNGDWMSASLSDWRRVMLTSGQTDNGKALNAHGARSIRWIRAASIGGSTPLLQSMTEHTKHYSSAAFVPYTDRVSIAWPDGSGFCRRGCEWRLSPHQDRTDPWFSTNMEYIYIYTSTVVDNFVGKNLDSENRKLWQVI